MKDYYTAKEIEGVFYLVNPNGQIDKTMLPSESLEEAMWLVWEMNTVHTRKFEFISLYNKIQSKLKEEKSKQVYVVDRYNEWIITALIVFGKYEESFENNLWDNSEVIASLTEGRFELEYKVCNDFDLSGNFIGNGWDSKTLLFLI